MAHPWHASNLWPATRTTFNLTQRKDVLIIAWFISVAVILNANQPVFGNFKQKIHLLPL